MFHPLLPDFSKLKNQEIDDNITSLMKKYTISLNFGQGSVANQILIILEAYKEEQRKRFIDSNKKLIDQNKNLDDLINIDR